MFQYFLLIFLYSNNLNCTSFWFYMNQWKPIFFLWSGKLLKIQLLKVSVGLGRRWILSCWEAEARDVDRAHQGRQRYRSKHYHVRWARSHQQDQQFHSHNYCDVRYGANEVTYRLDHLCNKVKKRDRLIKWRETAAKVQVFCKGGRMLCRF